MGCVSVFCACFFACMRLRTYEFWCGFVSYIVCSLYMSFADLYLFRLWLKRAMASVARLSGRPHPIPLVSLLFHPSFNSRGFLASHYLAWCRRRSRTKIWRSDECSKLLWSRLTAPSPSSSSSRCWSNSLRTASKSTSPMPGVGSTSSLSRCVCRFCRAGNGSMGQMGHFFGWVTWVMGRGMVTHDPLLDYSW